ncbi:hypothetical protein OSB04_023187 [Centaurea solstitialis]|uniref:CCHC-type domain-containing protein n=1 Tax=Centaurea solstitialis TaxID=347529 RepID=A0AA38SIP9_9ASTR|nr:hypothetical protein OSB04_023187 [Centaurea solstitialis]
MPGRPFISRKKDASERGCQSKITKVGKQMTCKNCWEVGHNSRGCKNQKKDAPIKKKINRGRSSTGRGSRGRSSTGGGFVGGMDLRGGYRPQLGAEAMIWAVPVPVYEGAPPVNEFVPSVSWLEFLEDNVQLDAIVTNEQANPYENAIASALKKKKKKEEERRRYRMSYDIEQPAITEFCLQITSMLFLSSANSSTSLMTAEQTRSSPDPDPDYYKNRVFAKFFSLDYYWNRSITEGDSMIEYSSDSANNLFIILVFLVLLSSEENRNQVFIWCFV